MWLAHKCQTLGFFGRRHLPSPPYLEDVDASFVQVTSFSRALQLHSISKNLCCGCEPCGCKLMPA